MDHKQPSTMELIVETHIGLQRQGPGSPEMTVQALGFVDNLNAHSRIADFGCGTGGQTMILAQNIPGSIVGVDILPEFIDVFNKQAKRQNHQERVRGIVGSIEALSFPKEEFDLIWSEGVIDSIGFEKGLRYWHDFLKKSGYIAVTSPTWLTEERPAEIEAFWVDAVQGLGTVGENMSVMQKAGYRFVAAFTLPETCWTENYFIPRQAAESALLEKYAGNTTVEAYLADAKYEVELYAKYKRYYGYVFYIGKKI